jgi:hypothetical protein
MFKEKKSTPGTFKTEDENMIEEYPVILKESGHRRRENIVTPLFEVMNKACKVPR